MQKKIGRDGEVSGDGGKPRVRVTSGGVATRRIGDEVKCKPWPLKMEHGLHFLKEMSRRGTGDDTGLKDYGASGRKGVRLHSSTKCGESRLICYPGFVMPLTVASSTGRDSNTPWKLRACRIHPQLKGINVSRRCRDTTDSAILPGTRTPPSCTMSCDKGNRVPSLR